MTVAAAPARGDVEEGWGKVADAFRANFEGNPGEVGAACCVDADGRPVVDLWAGFTDRETNRPWNDDTIASTTKGATAICAHLLAQRGELDLDAPAAEYWPEFGAAGKEQIPVRWLLSHQAGLPVVDAALTFEDACAWYPVIRALEAQKPLWQPGTEHLYHAHTFGFLIGEVVRRITGRTLGTFFADEVDGVQLLDPATVERMTVVQTDRTRTHGLPPGLHVPADRSFYMSLGFWRACPPMPLLGPGSFGHPGSGGSIAFADPDAGVGFGYVPNLWSWNIAEPRARNLAAAVAACLG